MVEFSLHGVSTRTASYPRVRTAQAHRPRMVGPPGSPVTKIRPDPPSGLYMTHVYDTCAHTTVGNTCVYTAVTCPLPEVTELHVRLWVSQYCQYYLRHKVVRLRDRYGLAHIPLVSLGGGVADT